MTQGSGEHGRLVGGRYQLGEPLGRGGMGTVWLAVDALLRREVAVKEVRLADGLDEQDREVLLERALREARAAARVTHPNVVTIFDVVDDDERPWIVMEHVSARSLSEIIDRDGPLDPSLAAHIGLKLLGALRAARTAGVLHRDVKPSNVLVTAGTAATGGLPGRVVLTDFGIASVAGSTTLTATGLLTGSPEYLAPERVLGREPDFAADLWSLGVTLYQAVEGVSPFRRGGAVETLTAVLHDEPAEASRAGDLAPALTALLDKDPEGRPDEDGVEELLCAALDPATADGVSELFALPVVDAGKERTGSGLSAVPPPPGADLRATPAAGVGMPSVLGGEPGTHTPPHAISGGAVPGPFRSEDTTVTIGSPQPLGGPTNRWSARTRGRRSWAAFGGLAIAGAAALAFWLVPGALASGGNGGSGEGEPARPPASPVSVSPTSGSRVPASPGPDSGQPGVVDDSGAEGGGTDDQGSLPSHSTHGHHPRPSTSTSDGGATGRPGGGDTASTSPTATGSTGTGDGGGTGSPTSGSPTGGGSPTTGTPSGGGTGSPSGGTPTGSSSAPGDGTHHGGGSGSTPSGGSTGDSGSGSGNAGGSGSGNTGGSAPDGGHALAPPRLT